MLARTKLSVFPVTLPTITFRLHPKDCAPYILCKNVLAMNWKKCLPTYLYILETGNSYFVLKDKLWKIFFFFIKYDILVYNSMSSGYKIITKGTFILFIYFV